MGNSERRKFSLIMDHNAIWLSLVLAIITFTTPAVSAEPRVVCYYTNWSVYRPGTARFNPQNINPYLCTHLVYAFGGFTKDNTLKPFDKYQDIEKGGYAKFTGLKTYNKNLKTMLAIGGWNEGSSRFSPMVAAKERRREFVRNALKFLRQNRFDGLDLDWEYPAFRDGGKPKDRENYAKLVRELREEFEREAEKTGRPRLLLTMAVPAGIDYIQKGFDVKTLNQYLDWMNLLSYDYHSAFEPAVNHHAPLYPLEEPNEYSVDNELNIDYTIKFYLENGADPDKLVLGIPTYGRSYTLFNPDATDIGAPADGPGEQGDATREKGYLAYYEICEALKPKKQKKRSTDDDDDDDEEDSSEEEDSEDEPWTVTHPNSKAMGPVAYRGNQWVGYDDIDIVKKKAEYVAENGLGGIMFWSIDNDDFRGTCHGKPYPLIESAKEAYIAKLGSTDNVVVRERPKSGTSSSNRRRNRPRTTSTTTTVKPSTSNKSNKRKQSPSSSLASTTPSWNIVTPEPPTTPDPGSDFKCKDEGFFPHPRDCKKYFWCLDSGPSNLGIVAHHFTCPSGLFFNKAADSCDFARNVLCKQPAATTKAPATKAPTTEATTTTTTRRPVKLSTKNSALFRTTTTTTTTPEPEEEEEYEDEIEDDAVDVEAEDPRVIKELIDLIKKVGGVEQLEKQLHLAESSVSSDGAASTKPPAALNKKLIQNVLERTRTTNRFSGSNSLSSGSQNSRRGPQNAGIQPAADTEAKPSRRDGRPQYTTINRNRGTTSTTPEPEEDLDSVEEPEVPQVLNRARAVDSDVRAGTTSKPLQYVNIRRPRPTSDTADDTASRNALFERVEPFVSVSDTSNTVDITSARRENTPEYVTIRRQRPTTEEPTTVQYQNTEPEESSFETILEKEISSPPSQSQYTSIVRTRSTTLPPTQEPSSPDPTTVLAVQISSLLNAPNPEDIPMNIVVESEQSAESSEATEPPTTTTKTTTTTAPSSLPPRRTVLRRRGSTTTTTTTPAPSSSTTQVSERKYSFVQRRRPLSRPNEISSDSEENSNSRKIRSTTPDSREVDSGKVNDETQTRQSVVQSRRFRSRYEQNQAQDSIPAAATPVSRGQFRPRLNQDELVSLTPVETGQDVAPQFEPKHLSASRNVRRFRGRTFTTISENVADSEASAASVEVQRQNTFVPRGRSRFVITTTTEEPPQATEPPPRRPTLARFSPRPFSRAVIVSTTEDSVKLKTEDEPTVAPRLPTRLPFGRQRTTSASTSTLKPEIQPRRLPFPSRITTQQTVSEENDDEEIEDKNEDIHLSESAIEEQEHDDIPVEEPEIAQKSRRVVIKKVRPSSTTEQDLIDTTSELPVSIDETGRKKFRVIRRRPTSTTVAAAEEEEIATTVASEAPSATPTRIRKVIRKKIQRLVEEEPEIIAKSVGSVNAEIAVTETVANYGEKTRPTISVSSVPSSETEQEKESVSEVTESIMPVSETIEENEEKVKEIQQTEEAHLGTNTEEEKKQTVESEIAAKPEVVVEINEKAIDLSENKDDVASEPPLVAKEQETLQPETTTASTTKATTTPSRARLPYRPPKRPFTTSTESPAPSSRTYSRKYNAGVYTSPATVERPEGVRTTRRPLFAGRPFTRRPYTTARTTQKVEEEEEEYSDEDIFDEEPEDELVVLPPNQLFSKRPSNDRPDEDEVDEEILDEEELEEDDEEEEGDKPTSRQPFRPRVVNSNTFRTSTFTTELPKQVLVATQNRTAIFNRFGANKPVNDTKKRVINVPVGYNSPQPSTENIEKIVRTENDTEETEKAETTTQDNNTDITTEDDDYLTMTESTSTTVLDTETTPQDSSSTNTGNLITSTEEMEIDTSTDDYLEFDGETTSNPSTLDTTLHTNTIYEEPTTFNEQTTVKTTISNIDVSTEATPETTSALPKAPPIVKTQFDKLFSVSRVVEVSSKSEKHRLNKNNETRLIEEGVIMQEKKPTFDKIGEVSRFSLIKIFENEIPIYLTKLGHVYPVDNPPDNPIRIDEARNARALMNFNDGPRENLVASESINEAYRHINKVTEKPKTKNVVIVEQVDKKDTSQVEHVANGDDFLSYINEENNGKTERPFTLQYYQPDPAQWQFIPAAYENDKNIEKMKMNKGAKSFEIVTPRNMLTDPSTLPLEGLFKAETPAMVKKVHGKTENKPFVVYSVANDDSVNGAKISEVGGVIKTYVKGQELVGASVTEQATVKNPSPIFIQHQTTLAEAEMTTSSMMETMETMTTSPIVDMLTTQETTVTTEPTTIATTNEPTTAESILEEITTQKISLLDSKRSKFAFPRRPIGLKSLNTTRSNSLASSNSNRIPSKKNTTSSASKRNSTLSSSFNKANKTTSGFNPLKSRFSSIRAQNVPVDLKIKKFNSPKASQRSFSTEAPRTTTERRVSIKPIRPNLRPAFFPRRQSLTTKVQKDRRNNFLRRTKATAPPDTTDTTEPITATETIADTTTFTNRYTRRGNSKFNTPTGRKGLKKDAKEVDAKKEEKDEGGKIENRTRQPSSSGPKRSERPTRNYVRRRLGGANATTSSTRASTSTLATPLSSTLAATRRPFRVASRRRPLPTTSSIAGSTTAEAKLSTTVGSTTTTTLGTTTLASDESLQDIEERESIEDPALNTQNTPSLKKTVKIQRRPLTSLKELDQNPSATNEDSKGMAKEDDRKRQSKKYSASFKQNQLDEVLRQKSKSQEELDVTTEGTTDNDYSAETAVAIAAHQLLSAPLPLSDSIFDDQGKTSSKKSTQKSNSFQTTQDYQYTSPGFTTEYDTDDIPIPGRKSPVYSSTPGSYSSTPIYRTTFAEARNPSYSPNPAPGFSSTIIPLGGYSSGSPKTSGYSSTPGYANTREYSNTPRLSSFGSTPSQRPSGFTPTGFIGNGYSLSPALGPSTARYLETSNKYVAVPVDEYGYTGGLSQEPSYFTREYLLESPVTKTYDDEYQYLSPITTPTSATTRKSLPRKTVYKRISTTIRPTTEASRPVLATTTTKPRRTPQKKPFEKIAKPDVPNRTYRPIDNYDYYDDSQEKVHDKYAEGTKVIVHGKGVIQCLDIGNFPHPTSCKKFISCARMESGAIIGWEYVCPEGLSFDPVGGICNWSAGLGCQES